MFKLKNHCPTPKKASMNVFKIVRRMGLSVAVLSMFGFVSFSASAITKFSASAITKEEYEADNTLIPTPSASSPFYVVEPTSRDGADCVDVALNECDTAPVQQIVDFGFDTDLRTYLPGLMFIIR